jgi:tetraacyldisaccharide 4'-kinase
MKSFFEEMFFSPLWYHYVIIILLSPLSLVYGLVMWTRRIIAQKKTFKLPIISIGNLFVGGTGKTPFVIALASSYEGVAIVSRGYGRQSRGLIQVSDNGKILTSVANSGDEAMLMAESLSKASVIVSENRQLGIALAEKQGAKLIFLDDGFGQVGIEKFDIILEPQRIRNILPFPSGGFREFFFMKYTADLIVKEGKDFQRKVTVDTLKNKMLLVTAISNPKRLDRYLPLGVLGHYYLEDHAYFEEKDLIKYLDYYHATSILTTEKDAVKMRDFKLDISIMKLDLEINKEVFTAIDTYITSKKEGTNR